MLQNQFIQFASTVDGTTSHLPIPVVHGVLTKFFFSVGQYQDPSSYMPIIDIMDSDGTTVLSENAATIETPTVTSIYRMALLSTLPGVSVDTCFRLRSRVVQYSGNERIVFSLTNVSYSFVSDPILIKRPNLTPGNYKISFTNIQVQGSYAHFYIESSSGRQVLAMDISTSLSKGIDLTITSHDDYSFYLVGERSFTFTADSFQLQEFQYIGEQVILGYSNLLKRIDALDDYSIVEYWCDEEEFDFPFNLKSVNYPFRERLILPLRISDPQYKQEDEVYEKLSGEKVVLYASIGKEYDLETEYLSEDLHDKIIIALSCDHITIGDESVAKSGEYSVDWENYQTLEDGTKIAKAEAKVTLNYNSRNSN